MFNHIAIKNRLDRLATLGTQKAMSAKGASAGDVWTACEVRVTVGGMVLPDAYKDLCVIRNVSTRFALNEIPSAVVRLEVIDPRSPSTAGEVLTSVLDKCRVSARSLVQVRKRGTSAWITLFEGGVEQLDWEVLADPKTNLVELKIKHNLVRLQSNFSGKAFQNTADADVLKELLGVGTIQADKSHSLTAKRDQTIHWPFGASAWEFTKALLGRNGVCFWPNAKGGRVGPAGWSKDVIILDGIRAQIERLTWKHSALRSPKSLWVDQHDVQKQATVKMQGDQSLRGKGCFDLKEIPSLTHADSHLIDCGWLAPSGGATSKGRANGLVLSSAFQAARGTAVLRGYMSGAVGDVLKIEQLEKGLCGEGLVTAIEHEFSAETEGCITTFTVGLTPEAAQWPDIPSPVGMLVGRVRAYEKTHARKDWHEVWVDVAGLEGHVRARYSGPYASKNAALWLYPQLGDEVVLNTMAGDPCSLVMVGAMNNPINKLPAPWSVTDNDKRGLVFHKGEASLGLKVDQKAHRMEFGGGSGDEMQHITVDAKKGMTFEAKSGAFLVTAAKGGISLNAKEKDVQLHAKNHLTLGGDQGVVLSSDKATVKINAKTTVQVTAKDVAFAAGQSKIDLAQASITIKATSISAKGSQGASLSGGGTSELTLKSAGAGMKGPSVEIEGQAKTDVKAPMIALKP
ncbi:type VI secretion system Vgr family protein [Pseudomonas synxantha]|uniref:VgrG protein n=1 Tax=Pseudomonas synxantha TaxID=47883 RepID=A0AAU8U732_9PSED|nr:hypothetical protein [Pseudomonas synxantha]AKA86367.1 VgrG protein [Pseudomonas synxantha]